jgi:hypothetical protein
MGDRKASQRERSHSEATDNHRDHIALTTSGGDRISELPVDTSDLSDEEKAVITSVFPPQPVEQSTVPLAEGFQDSGSHDPGVSEIKSLVVVVVLFVIFTRDCVDDTIVRIFPSAETWYYKLAIRTVLFAAIYFLLTYFPIFGLRK